MGKWKLQIKQDFSAAHQLRNYDGKCEHIHGHNFGVIVEVSGTKLDEKIEYVMDFKELKKMTKSVLENLDHKHLNEVAFFITRNPSSENIAYFIYQEIKKMLPENIKMESVSVSEKDSSTATYTEE